MKLSAMAMELKVLPTPVENMRSRLVYGDFGFIKFETRYW
jgi:hypothetical protein